MTVAHGIGGEGHWVCFNIDPCGSNEVAGALQQLAATSEKLPDLRHVAYDRAMEGTHQRTVYQGSGLIPLVQRKRAPGGQKTKKVIETGLAVTGGTLKAVNITAIDGLPHVSLIDVAGKEALVPLALKKLIRRGDRAGKYRWYASYELPNHIGGGKVSIRLDEKAGDEFKKLNRAKYLTPFPDNDQNATAIRRIGRNTVESFNAKIERGQGYQRRSRHYGSAATHVNLLAMQMLHNLIVEDRFT